MTRRILLSVGKALIARFIPGPASPHSRETKPQPQVHRLPSPVDTLRQVLGDLPKSERGALKNARHASATYSPHSQDNVLFALDARDSVIVTLYDIQKREGVVLHLDAGCDVEKEVQKALRGLSRGRCNPAAIVAHLVGGIWLGGSQVGGQIRCALRSRLIEPSWEDWSFSSCHDHRYGATLNLETGDVTVFEHTAEVIAAYRRTMWETPPHSPYLPAVAMPASVAPMSTSAWAKRHLVSRADSEAAPDSSASGARPRVGLTHAVNGVQYVLTGEAKEVRKFRDAFVAQVDAERDKLSELSYSKITSVLQNIKDKTRDSNGIDLKVIRPPRRSATSAASPTEDSDSSVPGRDVRNRRRVARAARVAPSDAAADSHLTPRYTAMYTEQLPRFSSDQLKILSKTVDDVLARLASNMSSKAHPAPINGFSRATQIRIQNELSGKKADKLYSEALINWDGSGGGRGKWRLLFRQEGGGVTFFGVFDTHRTPHVPFT